MKQHLSEDDLNAYAADMQTGDAAYWRNADRLVAWAIYFESDAALFREVSSVGESMVTMRGQKWLAYHVPAVLRERYPLSKSQWRACLSWGVMVAEYEERVERTAEMAEWSCAWGDEHGGGVAPVQVIENEIATRKLLLELQVQERAPSPTTERTAILKAARTLLSLNGNTEPGMVALARVIGLRK